jgi:hypothetical protein
MPATTPLIALSDDQLDQVIRCAAPLLPQDRDQYFRRVAELLRDCEIIGDGAVGRAARQAQAELFRAPDLLTSLRRYRRRKLCQRLRAFQAAKAQRTSVSGRNLPPCVRLQVLAAVTHRVSGSRT